jgi:formamidopyrimidine-DNA glycosylase
VPLGVVWRGVEALSVASHRTLERGAYDGRMPELPEVETVRRRLAPVLEGATIERVEIGDPRLTRPIEPGIVAEMLVGETVASVDRRGKYLLWRLESGRTLFPRTPTGARR